VLLDPDGAEVAGATGSLVAAASATARRDPDVLDRPVEPDVPGARGLLLPSPRERLGAQAPPAAAAPPTESADHGTRPGMPDPTARPAPGPARHELPVIDDLALTAARHADRMLAEARERGDARWEKFLEPIPDRLRTTSCAPSARRRCGHGRRTVRRTPCATPVRGRDRAVPRGARPAAPRAGAGVQPKPALTRPMRRAAVPAPPG
jgi:hypothetical protein